VRLLSGLAPGFGVVLLGRVLLGVAIAGFWTVVTAVGPKLVGRPAGTRAISFIVAGVSAGTVIGLPAGQALGNLLGWRLTFATAAATGLVIVTAQMVLLPGISADGHTRLRDLGGVFRVPSARADAVPRPSGPRATQDIWAKRMSAELRASEARIVVGIDGSPHSRQAQP